jgi:acetyltransferase-like isoleucine patch superfamily enzyme
VTIEKNVWLGINVIVLKGVTICENTIVGAGSVVVRSLPPNVVAGGVPAKVLRSLEPQKVKTGQ